MATARKRGSSVCQECSAFNGNRARYCNVCSKPLRKISQVVDHQPIVYSCNISSLIDSDSALDIREAFSVKIRDQGPDYRCFVTKCHKGVYTCYYKECQMVESARQRPECGIS